MAIRFTNRQPVYNQCPDDNPAVAANAELDMVSVNNRAADPIVVPADRLAVAGVEPDMVVAADNRAADPIAGPADRLAVGVQDTSRADAVCPDGSHASYAIFRLVDSNADSRVDLSFLPSSSCGRYHKGELHNRRRGAQNLRL